MPSPEELLYSWTDSQSGFTVLAFALVTAGMVWMAASVIASAGAFGVSSGAGLGTLTSPMSIGALAGGAYAVGSTVLGGGGPVTSAQEEFLGSTGSGFLERTTAIDPHGQALAASVASRHVIGPMTAGLLGVANLYRGQCPEYKTTSQCAIAAVSPGILPRPDTYSKTNNVLSARARYESCVRRGLRGAELRLCFASGNR